MKTNLSKLLLFILILILFQYWLVTYYNFEFAPMHSDRSLNAHYDYRLHRSGTQRFHYNDMDKSILIWNVSKWIPESIDMRLYQMSVVRLNSSMLVGNTSIDRHIYFTSIIDYVMYLPRALTIGFFSPFPEIWIGKGSSPSMTLARKIVGVTTVFSYIFLIAFFLSTYQHIYKPKFLAILTFCILGILIYTYVQPNVGSLMRYRYGFYMLLVSFGLATIVETLLAIRNHRDQS